jgi:hypothetical protein
MMLRKPYGPTRSTTRLIRLCGMATILVGLLLIAANIGNTLFGRANWGDLTLANRMSSVLYFVGSLALVLGRLDCICINLRKLADLASRPLLSPYSAQR